MSVGGHIELNEDPNEAVVREVKEEVGLKIRLFDDLKPKTRETKKYRELIPPKFMNRHWINSNHEHVTLVYFALSNSQKVKPENKREFDLKKKIP